MADLAERLILFKKEKTKERGKEPWCNLVANSQAPRRRAGRVKTVCYCVLLSVPNKSLHAPLHPARGSGYQAVSPQVPAPGSSRGTNHAAYSCLSLLRAYFRRCSVHPWLCGAPRAKGSRKAAPVQLQSGKQKPPASSRSVHTELPLHFKKKQIWHESTEQRQHFFLLSGHLPCLCFRETTVGAS